MALDRQMTALACMGPWMLAAALLVMLGPASALGQTSVRIEVAPEAAQAPAVLSLTASVSAGEPVIAYRWLGLDTAPRCRQARCELPVSIASCRTVSVEVTTLLGAVSTATRAVCVGGAGGTPPRAELRIRGSISALEIDGAATPGSDPIVRTDLWIDSRAVERRPALLDASRGCHTVDLLAADARGRVGLDREVLCGDGDPPELWLGAMPEPCPIASTGTIALCVEADHPLGLPLERIGGGGPLDGCASSGAPSPELERVVVAARDERGVESTASLWSCTAPSEEPRSLLFVVVPPGPRLEGTAGQPLVIPITVAGGKPPFVAEVSLDDGARIAHQDLELDAALAQVRIRSLPAGARERRATVTMRDARGLRASTSTTVITRPGGFGRDGGPGNEPAAALSSDSSSGCSVAGGDGDTFFGLILLLGWIALHGRRHSPRRVSRDRGRDPAAERRGRR